MFHEIPAGRNVCYTLAMAEETFTLADLQRRAEEMKAQGTMPEPREFLKALEEVRKKYRPAMDQAAASVSAPTAKPSSTDRRGGAPR
ncbi:MAG: hypothetical protein HRJ53_00810 [Acidobacteria bacterium Pan2503]|uniref:Uncharacterized protein n=1 Tax=Candidatus Acidiferrum panamense TaxID=2741543 RepID=A0A7V8NM02_9BACT|nr:hypothetical protein [Candidatus Acidoferrum panamensis]